MNKHLKTAIVTLSIFFGLGMTSRAAGTDIYYYQDQFNDICDVIQYGDAPRDSMEWEDIVGGLKSLYGNLAQDKNVAKKRELLLDIKAVCLFMGEMSPNKSSYYCTKDELNRAKQLLNVQSKWRGGRGCVPIYSVSLWDGAYTSYYVESNEDSLMVLYKVTFTGHTKHTTLYGTVEAGVSRQCVRGLFCTVGDVEDIHFEFKSCDKQYQDMSYIQPLIIEPINEVYPDPDYLSKEEKQALKKKQKAQLKKDKEKMKKKAQKAKKKKKKQMAKERARQRKEKMKERDAKMKAAKDAKKEAKKEKK